MFNYILISTSFDYQLYVLYSIVRYFKWLHLAAAFMVTENIHSTNSKDHESENSLALSAIIIWILNGAYCTPLYSAMGLAKEACPEILLNDNDDPEDENAVTTPLMYEAGLYFICDIVADGCLNSYCIPWAKVFSPQFIANANEKGTLNDICHMLGGGQVQIGQCAVNPERIANRSIHPTHDVRNLRPYDLPLPQIGNHLEGLPIPNPQGARGTDVDYYHHHGGGNHCLDIHEDLGAAEEHVENPLKVQVQEILAQMYYDILQESPNKRNNVEGPWTNIPCAMQEQLAVEDLYMHLEFPFMAVQYIISLETQWDLHFSRFFPDRTPQYIGQNFGKCCYYHTYLTLVGRLTPHQLDWV